MESKVTDSNPVRRAKEDSNLGSYFITIVAFIYRILYLLYLVFFLGKMTKT